MYYLNQQWWLQWCKWEQRRVRTCRNHEEEMARAKIAWRDWDEESQKALQAQVEG